MRTWTHLRSYDSGGRSDDLSGGDALSDRVKGLTQCLVGPGWEQASQWSQGAEGPLGQDHAQHTAHRFHRRGSRGFTDRREDRVYHTEKGPTRGRLREQSPSPGDTSCMSRRMEGGVCGRQTLNAGVREGAG